MVDFMHCNACYYQPFEDSGKRMKMFLTSCYHIFCESCLQKSSAPTVCLKCKKTNMRTVEINSSMDPNLQHLFRPPKQMIQEAISLLKKKYDFHQMLSNSLMGHLKKQKERLLEMMRYCQQQAQISKEMTEEMNNLKEYVKQANAQIKEGEKEQRELKAELERVKKMAKVKNFKPGDFNTSMTGSVGSASVADTFDMQKLFDANSTQSGQPPPEAVSFTFDDAFRIGFFDSVPVSEQDTSMSTIGGNTGNDGRMGMNMINCASECSFQSEASVMNTPKLLGLPKKATHSRTPTGHDNPYLDLFSRSAQQFPGPSSRHTPTRSTMSSSGMSSRKSMNSQAGMPQSVTRGSLIPRVNTPSSMMNGLNLGI